MHQAIVSRVEKIIPIDGADKVQIALVLGEYCVVGKDVEEGHFGVLFPADLQLSEEYCRINNLHRDSELNSDKTKKGFFDKNRKVRAQKFLKVNSTAYFTSLDSLSYTGVSVFEPMFKFNDIGEFHICKRFESEEVLRKKSNVANSNARKPSEAPLFLKHKDSEQLRHYIDRIPRGALLSFHNKFHGTSFRVGNLPVTKKLSFLKRVVNRVSPVFPETQYEVVVGSRNVILKTPEKEGHHGLESFRFEIANQLKPFLGKGVQVYGEIVGFVNGRPIMNAHDIKDLKDKDFLKKYGERVVYSYGCKEHEYKFIIYRVTVVGVDGSIYEMPQKHLEKWCSTKGLEHTYEVHPQVLYDGKVEHLKEICEDLTERKEVLGEDPTDPTHLSEGIILRVDFEDRTDFYKSKSTSFRICEGHLTVDDIEELS